LDLVVGLYFYSTTKGKRESIKKEKRKERDAKLTKYSLIFISRGITLGKGKEKASCMPGTIGMEYLVPSNALLGRKL